MILHGVKFEVYTMQHDFSALHPILTFLQTGSVQVSSITDSVLVLASHLNVSAFDDAAGLRATINEGMTHVPPGSKFISKANGAALVKSGKSHYVRASNTDPERDVAVLHCAKFNAEDEHHQNILDGETNKPPADVPSDRDLIYILSPTDLTRDPQASESQSWGRETATHD